MTNDTEQELYFKINNGDLTGLKNLRDKDPANFSKKPYGQSLILLAVLDQQVEKLMNR